MKVWILGAGMTPFNRRKDESSYRDWAKQAFLEALEDSGCSKGDIDAIVVASESDFFSLQLNPAVLMADNLGLKNVQTFRTEGGGATGHVAVQMASALIMGGVAKCVAVLGYEACASHLSGGEVSYLYNQSYDSWFEGEQDITSTSIYALSALAYMAQKDATSKDFAQISVRNRYYATFNKNAHLPLHITVDDVLASPVISSPYHRLDCSPLSDGSACLILSNDNIHNGDKNRSVAIVGMGMSNDYVRLGDRKNTAMFTAKMTAAKQAYKMANVTPKDLSLVELYDSYSGAQMQAVEALGLTQNAVIAERDGKFGLEKRFAMNLSGGLLGQGVAVGAVGVAQFYTIYKVLCGVYAGVRSDWDSPYGLVDTHGGIATNCAVSVLERMS